jgi:D-proline reductase (dithiol) PrdB
MKIAENLEKWIENYQNECLKNFNSNNKINWKTYSYVKNEKSPKSTGIDLSESKLILISSAGGYLHKDDPFDAANPLGDYSIRTFPISSDLSNIKYSHEHYDTAAVKEDAQVLLPLYNLQEMVKEGIIGDMCEKVISFMGYQPDIGKVITETIPAILEIATEEQADAVLLVPS